MTKFKTALLATAANSFIGWGSLAVAQQGLNDLEIAHAAYTADVIDIDYANIALGKTKNPEVKAFAELMIRDHSAVNETAGALLIKLNVKPQDNAFSQAMVAGSVKEKAVLIGLTGPEFDKAYAANELAYHQLVNKTVGNWIPTIQNADLKVFVTQALVTFKVHEEHANHMVCMLN